MNLYISTYLFSAFLLVLGFFFTALPVEKVEYSAKAFLRSKKAALITFGISVVWFTFVLYNLGPSDFGDIKNLLILVFTGAGILSFWLLPDFLSVRGAAILALLLSREFLDSAFMQEPVSRLVLVSLTYLLIIIALYIGAIPFRLRDFFEYLFEYDKRVKLFGVSGIVLGLGLLLASLFY